MVLPAFMMYIVMIGLLINGTTYEMQRIEEGLFEEDYTTVSELRTYGTLEWFANRKYAEMSLDEFEKSIKSNPDWSADVTLNVDLVYNYFTYDIENNFFYKHIAREQL